MHWDMRQDIDRMAVSSNMRLFSREIAEIFEKYLDSDDIHLQTVYSIDRRSYLSNPYGRLMFDLIEASRFVDSGDPEDRYIEVNVESTEWNNRNHLTAYVERDSQRISVVIDNNIITNPTNLEKRSFYYTIRQSILHELIHIFDPKLQAEFREIRDLWHDKDYVMRDWEIDAWIHGISDMWVHAGFEKILIEVNDKKGTINENDIFSALEIIRQRIINPMSYIRKFTDEEEGWSMRGIEEGVRPQYGYVPLPPSDYIRNKKIYRRLLKMLQRYYQEIIKEVENMI
jgi:hypothetical protein